MVAQKPTEVGCMMADTADNWLHHRNAGSQKCMLQKQHRNTGTVSTVTTIINVSLRHGLFLTIGFHLLLLLIHY